MSPFLNELLRPWKVATLAIGVSLLIWGSFYYAAPDWDVPISLIMALFAYLTAGWSMHVMVERRWRDFPLMLLSTWWTVDGCYSLYWFIKNPVALDFMRSANAPASLSLYWMCGLIWYWNGSLKELVVWSNQLRNTPNLGIAVKAGVGPITKGTLQIAAFLIASFLVYLAWYWWDMRQLRAFCEDVRLGTPVSELRQIANRHGINPKWLKGDGALNQKTNQWSYYVPSVASAGANVCAIRHNKVTVISTIVEID